MSAISSKIREILCQFLLVHFWTKGITKWAHFYLYIDIIFPEDSIINSQVPRCIEMFRHTTFWRLWGQMERILPTISLSLLKNTCLDFLTSFVPSELILSLQLEQTISEGKSPFFYFVHLDMPPKTSTGDKKFGKMGSSLNQISKKNFLIIIWFNFLFLFICIKLFNKISDFGLK